MSDRTAPPPLGSCAGCAEQTVANLLWSLVSATNLMLLLSQCEQTSEADQLLRGTLYVSRRVLGPANELTLDLIECVRTLDSTRNALFWIIGGLAVFLVCFAFDFAYLAGR